MRLFFFVPALTLASAVLLGSAGTAQAGLAACGNINVEANATCEVEPPGVECTSQCTPIRFEAACSAQLEVDCRGECRATAAASCTASCQGTCETQCNLDPPKLDCEASCSLRADAHCTGECAAQTNKGQCEASCKATFSGECQASCAVTPPSATCKAKCEGSCSGSCKAEVNASCQVDCQSTGFASCTADLKGGCELDCTSSQGALYCDGQYVDHGNNLENCIAALNSKLTVDVQGSATGSCVNGKCEGEASGSASCALGRAQGKDGALLAGLALVFALGLRRRRSMRL